MSKEVLIRTGDGQESEDEFNTLFAELSEELKPEGTLEYMCVERVAICYWRLKRALRAVVGEIRKEQDAVLFRRFIDDWDPTRADENVDSAKESGLFDRVYKSLKHIIDRLESDRDETVRLTDTFKTNSDAIIESMKEFNFPSDQIRDFEKKATKLLESNEIDKKKIRELYSDRTKDLEGWMDLIEHYKALKFEADLLSRSLPASDVVE